jgi:hypothetical protein
MSAIPDGRAADDLRAAAEVLREGNTWIGRALSLPLADLLEAVADVAPGSGPDDAVPIPVVAGALAVAGVVTGRPSPT